VKGKRHFPSAPIAPRAGDTGRRLRASEDVDQASKDEESGVGEVHMRRAMDRTAGSEQPQQNWSPARPQDFGRLVLAAASGADFLPEMLQQLGCRRGLDTNAGVGKDRAGCASDQVSAGEAGLVAGDLDVML
jgi:hypothetical protein